MNKLQIIEIKGKRVLTTKQLAEAYETEERVVQQNYRNNAKRYIAGKHFVCLTGQELKQFKDEGENFSLVGRRTSALYLWTEKGALLHAKSLNTDKAWQVYDYLVDYYFRTKEEQVQKVKKTVPVVAQRSTMRQVVDVPENEKSQRRIAELRDNMTGIEEVLKMYNRYTTEEEHKHIASVLSAMCVRTFEIGMGFRDEKPKIIEKAY